MLKVMSRFWIVNFARASRNTGRRRGISSSNRIMTAGIAARKPKTGLKTVG